MQNNERIEEALSNLTEAADRLRDGGSRVVPVVAKVRNTRRARKEDAVSDGEDAAARGLVKRGREDLPEKRQKAAAHGTKFDRRG